MPHGVPLGFTFEYRWKDMPDEYPSPATCWRRLKRWKEDGTWFKVWRTFLSGLDKKGKLEWPESFIDGSFVPAKGGLAIGKTKRGKGTKWMIVTDKEGDYQLLS